MERALNNLLKRILTPLSFDFRRQRIILFHSRGPSCANTSATSEQCPKGMHSWSDHVWESEPLKGLGEKDWQQQSCSISTSAESSPGVGINKDAAAVGTNKAFFSVNQFLAQPHPDISRELNEFDTVAKRVEACSSQHAGRPVNFVSTDFWHLGSVVEFVQRQNKAKTSID